MALDGEVVARDSTPPLLTLNPVFPVRSSDRLDTSFSLLFCFNLRHGIALYNDSIEPFLPPFCTCRADRLAVPVDGVDCADSLGR